MKFRGEKKRKLMGDSPTAACVHCGLVLYRRELTLDHIIPKSKGGSNKMENLVLACNPCNSERGSMDFSEFQEKMRIRLESGWRRPAPVRGLFRKIREQLGLKPNPHDFGGGNKRR